MADPRSVLDSLVKDACDMQRMTGTMPTPQEARDGLVSIVDKAAKKRAEAEDKPAVKTPPRAPSSDAQIEAAYKKAGGVGTDVHVIRPGELQESPITTTRPQTRAQRKDERMKRQRIRLLWALPDWQARIKSVDILSAQGFRGPAARLEAERQYTQILEDSERVFGPYWKRRPKKLYSSGSGKRGTVQP